MSQTQGFEAISDLRYQRMFFFGVFEFLVQFFIFPLEMFRRLRTAMFLALLLSHFKCRQPILQITACKFFQSFPSKLKHAIFSALKHRITDYLLCFQLFGGNLILLVNSPLILLLQLLQILHHVFFTALQTL